MRNDQILEQDLIDGNTTAGYPLFESIQQRDRMHVQLYAYFSMAHEHSCSDTIYVQMYRAL